MTYKKFIALFTFFGFSGFVFLNHQTETPIEPNTTKSPLKISFSDLALTNNTEQDINTTITEVLLAEQSSTTTQYSQTVEKRTLSTRNQSGIFSVPFYSQFADITATNWQKVGCGIASLAMLIEFYEPESVTVDHLLHEGIAAGAFLPDAGWTHAGLINLSKKYGLTGSSHDMAGLSMDAAFSKLESVLKEGPVMVSVHYTFDPKNPIPHLVVINGVNDGKVYYNDPAEKVGGGSLSIDKFQRAWKKRYIEIRANT